MTIKTIPQVASTISFENTNRDMQKRTVRKNLFGTTVDREELQQNIALIESENKTKLKGFKYVSVIGRIDRNPKRLPNFLDSESEEDESHEHEATRQISTDNDSTASERNSKIGHAEQLSPQALMNNCHFVTEKNITSNSIKSITKDAPTTSSSSTSSTSSSSDKTQPTSSKKSEVKLHQRKTNGQKTITEYFPVTKRQKNHR